MVRLAPWSVSIALACGLIYAGALAVTLTVCGYYLNPALTLMLWVFKQMDGAKAVALIFVQMLGSVLAGFALRLLLPSQIPDLVATRLGAPHLNQELFLGVTLTSMLKGVGVELVLT